LAAVNVSPLSDAVGPGVPALHRLLPDLMRKVKVDMFSGGGFAHRFIIMLCYFGLPKRVLRLSLSEVAAWCDKGHPCLLPRPLLTVVLSVAAVLHNLGIAEADEAAIVTAIFDHIPQRPEWSNVCCGGPMDPPHSGIARVPRSLVSAAVSRPHHVSTLPP
jgi:hypothetical protein